MRYIIPFLLLAFPAHAGDCWPTKRDAEAALNGFQPIALGFASGDRQIQIWSDAHRDAYVIRIEADGTHCIVSARIKNFNWLTVMPVGTPL